MSVQAAFNNLAFTALGTASTIPNALSIKKKEEDKAEEAALKELEKENKKAAKEAETEVETKEETKIEPALESQVKKIESQENQKMAMKDRFEYLKAKAKPFVEDVKKEAKELMTR